MLKTSPLANCVWCSHYRTAPAKGTVFVLRSWLSTASGTCGLCAPSSTFHAICLLNARQVAGQHANSAGLAPLPEHMHEDCPLCTTLYIFSGDISCSIQLLRQTFTFWTCATSAQENDTAWLMISSVQACAASNRLESRRGQHCRQCFSDVRLE